MTAFLITCSKWSDRSNPDIRVIRNDEMTVEEMEKLNPEAIILSPGPGKPCDAGVCKEAAKYFAGKVPILGVCLGHQAICEEFGATVSYAKTLMHGKQSKMRIDNNSPIFRGLPEEIRGSAISLPGSGRGYHTGSADRYRENRRRRSNGRKT